MTNIIFARSHETTYVGCTKPNSHWLASNPHCYWLAASGGLPIVTACVSSFMKAGESYVCHTVFTLNILCIFIIIGVL